MYFHDGSWGAGAWVAMTLMMILFWGVFVAAIVLIVRALRTGRRDDGPASTAGERILDERFARGEIDAGEYQRRRELLRSK